MSVACTGSVVPVHVVLIVNPFATRVSDARLAAVEVELRRVADLTVVKTQHPRHATELVSEACRGGCEAVIVFSGDGGFNEALNGLDVDVPIGFLPGGGTSVLPRALGLPADPVVASRRLADALEQGRSRRITLGRVNGRRFAFSAGIGLDAAAVRRVDELGRREDGKRPGDLAFALAVVRVLAAHRGRLEPTLEVKGIGRAAFAFIANGSPYTYAKWIPLQIAPEAQFELGLDFVAPVHVRKRSLVRVATLLLTGHSRSGPVLYGHDLDRLEVVCDHPMPLQVDGEDLGDVESALFEAERGAVSVLI
jgi:diacylglycerol kinase family enzyme